MLSQTASCLLKCEIMHRQCPQSCWCPHITQSPTRTRGSAPPLAVKMSSEGRSNAGLQLQSLLLQICWLG